MERQTIISAVDRFEDFVVVERNQNPYSMKEYGDFVQLFRTATRNYELKDFFIRKLILYLDFLDQEDSIHYMNKVRAKQKRKVFLNLFLLGLESGILSSKDVEFKIFDVEYVGHTINGSEEEFIDPAFKRKLNLFVERKLKPIYRKFLETRKNIVLRRIDREELREPELVGEITKFLFSRRKSRRNKTQRSRRKQRTPQKSKRSKRSRRMRRSKRSRRKQRKSIRKSRRNKTQRSRKNRRRVQPRNRRSR